MTRGRVRAALVDEALVAVITAVLYAMALQTGVTALLALPVSALVAPLGSVTGIGLVPLTVWGVVALLWAGVHLVYRVVGSGSPSGQTPGKRLAGLRVVSAETRAPPGYRAAIVREAVLLAEVVTVAGLLAALARHPWHDAVAGTRLDADAQTTR